MGIVDYGSQIGIVETAEPAALATGTIAEPAISANRRLLIMDPNELSTYWGQAFAFTTGQVTINTAAETGLLSIVNPAGSGKILKLKSLVLTAPQQANGLLFTTATAFVFKFYTTCTLTGGTAITVVGARQTGQAAAVSTVNKLPTTSAVGTVFLQRYVNSTNGTDLDLDFAFDRYVEPGQNMVISATASLSGITTTVSGEFAEQAS